MEIKEAINIVYDGLVGENSIPTDLRMKNGLDYEKLSRVREAINYLISEYSSKLEIPKKLAIAFVDIYGAFQFKKGFYSEKELDEYEKLGIEFQDLAYELFDSDMYWTEKS